jgi:AraC family transcriptional regulator
MMTFVTWQTMGAGRLRALLDALLADLRADADGSEVASRAHLSRFHFDRLVRAAVGEPPARLRRRLLLEQAAYALGRGAAVTDVAFASGYGSPEAFSRAFSRAYGCPPSDFARLERSFALPAPNGIHFHPPCGLVLPGPANKESTMDLTERLVEHDIWLTGALIEQAGRVPEEVLDRPITMSVESLDDDSTIRRLLAMLVRNKEMWGANFTGADYVDSHDCSLSGLRARWPVAAQRYRGAVHRIAANDEWGTAFIDAVCEPAQTFTYGGAVAHVLTFSAYRRTLALLAFYEAGYRDLGIGDPMHFNGGGSGP